MRIFYAACNTPNPSFRSDLWRANLLLPLIDLGHDVVEFQYDLTEALHNVFPGIPEQKEYIEQNRPKLSEELIVYYSLLVTKTAKFVQLLHSIV